MKKRNRRYMKGDNRYMTGLEDFLFPKSKRGNQKDINRMKMMAVKGVMKAYYCEIHHIAFWRYNNRMGICSFCNFFDSKHHIPISSMRSENINKIR